MYKRQGDNILVKPRDRDARLYRYQLGHDARGEVIDDAQRRSDLERKLSAFVQTATASLLSNTTGVTEDKAAQATR